MGTFMVWAMCSSCMQLGLKAHAEQCHQFTCPALSSEACSPTLCNRHVDRIGSCIFNALIQEICIIMHCHHVCRTFGISSAKLQCIAVGMRACLLTRSIIVSSISILNASCQTILIQSTSTFHFTFQSKVADPTCTIAVVENVVSKTIKAANLQNARFIHAQGLALWLDLELSHYTFPILHKQHCHQASILRVHLQNHGLISCTAFDIVT